jgi:hypothetical protein
MKSSYLLFYSALIVLILCATPFGCKHEEADSDSCNPAQFMDLEWVLVAFGDEQNPSSILPGLGEVTFVAQGDSLFFATDGCNTTDGKYGITSDCSIAFFNAGTTLAYYGPLVPTPESIAINNQRRDIIHLLVEGGTFSCTNETMVIHANNGKFMSFIRRQ